MKLDPQEQQRIVLFKFYLAILTVYVFRGIRDENIKQSIKQTNFLCKLVIPTDTPKTEGLGPRIINLNKNHARLGPNQIAQQPNTTIPRPEWVSSINIPSSPKLGSPECMDTLLLLYLTRPH